MFAIVKGKLITPRYYRNSAAQWIPIHHRDVWFTYGRVLNGSAVKLGGILDSMAITTLPDAVDVCKNTTFIAGDGYLYDVHSVSAWCTTTAAPGDDTGDWFLPPCIVLSRFDPDVTYREGSPDHYLNGVVSGDVSSMLLNSVDSAEEMVAILHQNTAYRDDHFCIEDLDTVRADVRQRGLPLLGNTVIPLVNTPKPVFIPRA